MPLPMEGIFVAWRVFQRRTETLASKFNLETRYYYCAWEEKSRFHKACSYLFKTVSLLGDLIRYRPKLVFIQLPPTPVLYLVSIYCRMSGSQLVADAHNSMIFSKWLKWPLEKSLLRRADVLLVHNEDVEVHARQFGLDAITLRDPLPILDAKESPESLRRFNLQPGEYVMVPWSFSADEPIDELIQAAAAMPHRKFVMTWFAERLPSGVRAALPSNLVLTGYLDNSEFCSLFSQAAAALVLTTREGTQPCASSEAMVLGVPLIVSDLKTTRKLYEEMPVYIPNTAQGIVTGVETVFRERDRLSEKIRAFCKHYGRSLDAEIEAVKLRLGLAS